MSTANIANPQSTCCAYRRCRPLDPPSSSPPPTMPPTLPWPPFQVCQYHGRVVPCSAKGSFGTGGFFLKILPSLHRTLCNDTRTDTPLYVRHINPRYAPMVLLVHPTVHARRLSASWPLDFPFLLTASHRAPHATMGAFSRSPAH